VLSPTPEHVMRSETGATRVNIVLKTRRPATRAT